MVGFGALAVLYFGLWALIAGLLVLALMASRRPSIIASPAIRGIGSPRLPGATGALLKALVRAESDYRAFIAEAAVFETLNDQRAADELAGRYAELETEVGDLIRRTPALDDRWELLWSHKPSWTENQPHRGLFTSEEMEKLVRYMAFRCRQIHSGIDFLTTGNDDRVRHIRTYVKGGRREASVPENRRAIRHRGSVPLA